MCHISSVVQFVCENLCEVAPTSLPSVSTVCNMSNEMRCIAMEQAVSVILESEHVNLGWDATSINEKHINEVHINAN